MSAPGSLSPDILRQLADAIENGKTVRIKRWQVHFDNYQTDVDISFEVYGGDIAKVFNPPAEIDHKIGLGSGNE